MTTAQTPRSRLRYPGLWLALAVVIGVALAFVALGALESPDSSPTVLVATLDTEDIHVAAVIEGGSDTLLVGHHDGLLASTDNGRSWTEDLTGVDVMALAAKADHALLVGGHGFIGEQRTDDTYVELDPRLADDDIHALTRSRVDPDRFWLVTGEGVLYRSVDGGGSWVDIDEGPIVRVASGAGGPDDLWAIDAFRGLVSSADGGRTWSDGSDVPGSPVNALAVSSDGATLLLGTGMGAFLSDDAGETWDLILDEPVAAATFEDNPDGSVVAFLVTPGGGVYRYH
jgi:photosystem II stability/assembly factor-like uncharacterized protein